ncbi:Glucoamylase [Fulvia fulva]|uniref:Glucoamylase n=1 Tax=Passalora fulva TaxID=5499 RepID=A0A9Q8USX1_PASFU|nr:Glucoamylase [Fulvia fulva]KAK4617784.1 Glucoamylase [Fulvia fulva]KAK4619082.1 Glucoamylase [Fulvia fulva]UJO21222.1 Glucoamylase [Fulvia fulva]WPV18327.1 Glucoamylase [Fulvia fulva]WPV33250.1 Glucoamylase [Fulvia fulva]
MYSFKLLMAILLFFLFIPSTLEAVTTISFNNNNNNNNNNNAVTQQEELSLHDVVSNATTNSTLETLDKRQTANVVVTFNLLVVTTYGQMIGCIGSIAQLGSWNPRMGLAMNTDPAFSTTFPNWIGTISLPAGTAIMYKYVKLADSGETWEADPNRAWTVPSGVASATLYDSWQEDPRSTFITSTITVTSTTSVTNTVRSTTYTTRSVPVTTTITSTAQVGVTNTVTSSTTVTYVYRESGATTADPQPVANTRTATQTSTSITTIVNQQPSTYSTTQIATGTVYQTVYSTVTNTIAGVTTQPATSQTTRIVTATAAPRYTTLQQPMTSTLIPSTETMPILTVYSTSTSVSSFPVTSTSVSTRPITSTTSYLSTTTRVLTSSGNLITQTSIFTGSTTFVTTYSTTYLTTFSQTVTEVSTRSSTIVNTRDVTNTASATLYTTGTASQTNPTSTASAPTRTSTLSDSSTTLPATLVILSSTSILISSIPATSTLITTQPVTRDNPDQHIPFDIFDDFRPNADRIQYAIKQAHEYDLWGFNGCRNGLLERDCEPDVANSDAIGTNENFHFAGIADYVARFYGYLNTSEFVDHVAGRLGHHQFYVHEHITTPTDLGPCVYGCTYFYDKLFEYHHEGNFGIRPSHYPDLHIDPNQHVFNHFKLSVYDAPAWYPDRRKYGTVQRDELERNHFYGRGLNLHHPEYFIAKSYLYSYSSGPDLDESQHSHFALSSRDPFEHKYQGLDWYQHISDDLKLSFYNASARHINICPDRPILYYQLSRHHCHSNSFGIHYIVCYKPCSSIDFYRSPTSNLHPLNINYFANGISGDIQHEHEGLECPGDIHFGLDCTLDFHKQLLNHDHTRYVKQWIFGHSNAHLKRHKYICHNLELTFALHDGANGQLFGYSTIDPNQYHTRNDNSSTLNLPYGDPATHKTHINGYSLASSVFYVPDEPHLTVPGHSAIEHNLADFEHTSYDHRRFHRASDNIDCL